MPEDSGCWRVFLSSTFREMEEYRRAIINRFKQDELANWIDLVALDDGTYSWFTPDASVLSVDELEACDLVVLLIGRELGSRAGTGSQSFTEQEIAAAQRNGIPVYAFMLAADAPDPGSERYWDRKREQDFRNGVRKHSTPFDVEASLQEPEKLAEEVVKLLADWLKRHARPHRLPATDDRRDVIFFVNRNDPYRELKRRVLDGRTSVVSGFYGTGKSTLAEALAADHDVVREYAMPATQLSVDLSVPTSPEGFRQQAESALEAIRTSPPETRHLLVVTMSSVLDPDTLHDSPGQVEDLIRSSFPSTDPLAQRRTLIFKVPEERVGSQLRHYLGLSADGHIKVPDFTLPSALQLLLVMGGLHEDCEQCERYGPDAARAAGCWPPLLADCARSFDELESPDEQHRYLRHAAQAFNGQLSGRDQMHQTFERQRRRLPEQPQLLLSAAGVLLPKPFAFSAELIEAASGLSTAATTEALKTLTARGYIEPAGPAAGAAGEEAVGEGFTLHPFYWDDLHRYGDEGQPGPGAAQFRANAFKWLDDQVDDILEDLTYQGWFNLLEDHRSQALISNWIYQLAHLDNRRRAAEELARIVLKAHWWWDWYVPFGFSKLLGDTASKAVDWSPATDGDDLTAVTEALRTLSDSYPRAGQFDAPPPPAAARAAWGEAKEALVSVAKYLEIPVDDDVVAVRQWAKAAASPGDAGDSRPNSRLDIAKLLHILLAHCDRCSFGETVLADQVLRDIERHYRSALALAKQQRDDWNPPWLWSELGDAELTAARARRRKPAGSRRTDAACTASARDCAQKALRLARQQGQKEDAEPDFEILSITERLLGDIDRHAGDSSAAAQHYARAVHYAHCFEVCPENQPDPYTRTFEWEQFWRVSAPLLELAGAGGHDPGLRTLCGQIAEFLGIDPGALAERVTKAAAFKGKDRKAEVENLFAPYILPPLRELDRADDRARRLIDQFRDEATEIIRSTERHNPDPDLVRVPDDG
jgi:hypothetical protein